MPGPFFFFGAIVDIITLVAAAGFAIRPAEKKLSVLRPLCAATAFSSLAAFLFGMANGLTGLSWALDGAADPAATTHAWHTFLGGMAESPAALILGFAVLSVCWLLVAVGLRRQA